MSKRELIDSLLESFDDAISSGEPDDSAAQFVVWVNRVGSALRLAGMQEQWGEWDKESNSIRFTADSNAFPAQARSMRSLLLAMRPRVENPLIALELIDGLRAASSSCALSLVKLIRLCEELNQCFDQGCYYAVVALTRMLMDHIPPYFAFNSFNSFASGYGGNTGRSFKKSMQHLEESARQISDRHLHQQIRSHESCPTEAEVTFSNDLNVLLTEVLRTSPTAGRQQ